MPKSDFISDKLLDMSDHFKRDYAERHHLPLPEELRQESGHTPGAERERRELEERIIRDTAAVQKELEELELRSGELNRFLALAQKVQDRCSGQPDPGELGKLRVEYFGALGRVSAVSPAAALSAAAADGNGKPQTWREIIRSSLPAAVAMVLAALIVAGTLIALLA